METHSSLTVILSALGAAFILISASVSFNQLKLVTNKKLKAVWRILTGFMILFFFGYLVVIYLVANKHTEMIVLLAGLIFLFGAVFVFVVVKTGYSTVKSLLNTTVAKSYVENIIQSMTDTLIVINIDKDVTIETINNAAKNLLKYSDEELVGNPLTKILPDNKKGMIINGDLVSYKSLTDTEMCFM